MLEWLKTVDGSQLGIIFMVLTALTLWTGNKADPHLDKHPIIDFEKAGSIAQAQNFLREVGEIDLDARSKLVTALRWDFLFLIIYPVLIAVGCLLVINFLVTKNLWGVGLGFVLIALQPLAAIFDAVENYALLRVLGGSVENLWPQLAKWFATAKFYIVYAGLGYMLFYGMGAIIWAKAKGR